MAFYLPQFHVIDENDRWWGEGFTEWTNVRRAVPLFEGHDQPRVPADLGYYDLTDAGVLHRQARIAREADVDAFCFYFYWFGGRRLLERPLEAFLADGPDFPFCLSWANESWTRRWDGRSTDVLIAQEYGPDTAAGLLTDLEPYLRDRRYLRVDGAAVLLVHRVEQLPDAAGIARRLREEAERRGVGPLHLVATETVAGLDPRPFGFDAAAEFPPVGSNTLSAAWLRPLRHRGPFRGRLLSYPRLSRRFVRRATGGFTRYAGVMPGWDNTARRGTRATVFVGSSPARYGAWLRQARLREQRARGADGLVFVNAWNEWGEGAYLEPDQRWGRRYLDQTRWDAPPGADDATAPPRGTVTRSFLVSVAGVTGSSVLAAVRRLRRGVAGRGAPARAGGGRRAGD